jgi:type I restriction enzyme S subunit
MKKGWQTKRLGDVCEVIMGQSPDGESYNTKGEGVPLINGPVEFSDESFGETIRSKFTTQPTKFCKKDDLILCVRGSTTGRMNIAGFDACVGRGVAAIRAKQYQPWVNHFISSKRDEIHGKGTGATFPNVSGAMLADFELVIPPLAEQQRIVGLLDEAFTGLATAKANAEKNHQNARALFESHLQSVFTQRGKGWVEKTIGECCILRSGTTLPKEIERPSGEIPYLKVADMNIKENLNGVTCSSRYINKNDVNASNLLPVGTTIFPKRGGAILTNKKRLTKRTICADLNIMGVTPKTGLLPEFLFNFFLRLDLREINNGSSIPQINNYSVEPLLIAFPNSITEQKAIVTRLTSLSAETQRLATLYERKLAALEALKKSLLHRAFSGGL